MKDETVKGEIEKLNFPLTSLQKKRWLVEKLDGNYNPYVITRTSLLGQIDILRFEKKLVETVKNTFFLLTSITRSNKKLPFQTLDLRRNISLQLVDLISTPHDQVQSLIESTTQNIYSPAPKQTTVSRIYII